MELLEPGSSSQVVASRDRRPQFIGTTTADLTVTVIGVDLIDFPLESTSAIATLWVPTAT